MDKFIVIENGKDKTEPEVAEEQIKYPDDVIQKALKKYLKDKKYRNEYYKNRYKVDPVFRETQKENSREYYYKHKEKIKQKYLDRKKATNKSNSE